MTQEIQERNKEIALMLGWKEATLEYKLKWCGVKTKDRLNRLNKDFVPILMKENEEPLWEDSLIWHSDWNWLMEAVEFIENKGYDVVTAKQSCGVWTGAKCHVDGKGINKKEAIFIAVSDFAKLYNNKEL